jgi:nucleotide-binding universal stress UspA family protein
MQPLTERAAIGDLLCATDFSQHARDAVVRAAWLPVTPGSSVTLLHVVPTNLGEVLEARLRAAAGKLMEAAEKLLLSEAERAGSGALERFIAISSGVPAEAVNERARHGRVDLVVVGRGERRSAGEHLLGSTAERIVRACESDVLIVGRPPEGPYRKPLVAVDLSEVSQRVIEGVLRMTDASVKSISVVMSFDAPYLPMLNEAGMPKSEIDEQFADLGRDAKSRLESWLGKTARPGVTLEPVVVPGDPRRQILVEALRSGADLIAVGSRRHSRIGGILLGSVSEAIARSASRDVLVVR